MKKNIFLLFLTVVLVQVLNAAGIEFDTNSNTIAVRSYDLIDQIASVIKAKTKNKPSYLVEIRGHTDNTGNLKKNMALSSNRAESVRVYLIKNSGIKNEFIISKGYGPTEPAEPNKTKEGRQANRRVEVYLDGVRIASGQGIPSAWIRWFMDRVVFKPEILPEWKNAYLEAELFTNDRLNAQEKSAAALRFDDGGYIDLSEKTMITIYGDAYAAVSRLKDRKYHIDLETGSLYNRLLGADKNFMLYKTQAADVELHSAEADIASGTDKQALISVHEGYAKVSAAGDEIIVREGYGVKVNPGKKPDGQIRLIEPPDGIGFVKLRAGTYKAVWNAKKEASGYEAQFSGNKDFNGMERIVNTSGNSAEITFNEKKPVFFRIKAFDKTGLSSRFTSAVKVEESKNFGIAAVGGYGISPFAKTGFESGFTGGFTVSYMWEPAQFYILSRLYVVGPNGGEPAYEINEEFGINLMFGPEAVMVRPFAGVYVFMNEIAKPPKLPLSYRGGPGIQGGVRLSFPGWPVIPVYLKYDYPYNAEHRFTVLTGAEFAVF